MTQENPPDTAAALITEAEGRRSALLQDLLDRAERGQDTTEAAHAIKQFEDEIARLREQQAH